MADDFMADSDPDPIGFGDPVRDHAADDWENAIAWDADDTRRQKDQFAPPMDPCECYCLHCHRTFMSDGIWFQRVIGDKSGFEGFWMCPTPNCGGAGFTFDIFPTDPSHPANAGWVNDEDDDEEDDAWDEDLDDEWDEEFKAFDFLDTDETAGDWDPDESIYRWMDAHDDDIEGEEWKHGLQPGEKLEKDPASGEGAGAMSDWNDEARYDAPDERPREMDWSDREDRDTRFNEDDIPF